MMAFKNYQSELRANILGHMPAVKRPQDVRIQLSPARESNVLEGLNLALTGEQAIFQLHILQGYEGYNVDRNFDRTGKVCLVITPGCGVFDAYSTMVSLTKSRVLDLGGYDTPNSFISLKLT